MSIVTLESVADDGGLICDGDWIESKDQDPAGKIRLIQLADVGDGQFLNKSQRFVNDSTFQRLNCTLIREGDLLIARMPDPLGRTCVVPKLAQRAITAVDVCIVRPNPSKVDAEWLSFRLNATDIRQEIQSHVQGATRARVPTGKLKGITFELPCLPEQREIATRLKAQLAEVEAARQATLTQVQDADFLSGRLLQAAFDNLDKAPVKPLGEWIVSYRNGFGKRPGTKEAGPIVLRIADVSSGTIDLSKPRRGAVSVKEAETYRLQTNDLLFIRVNGAREIVGRCCIVGPDVPADTIFNDHLIRVCLKPSIDAEYARLCAGSPSARSLIEKAASTSAGQLTINQEVIASVSVPNLSIDEQREFTARLKSQLVEVGTFRTALDVQRLELDLLPSRILAEAFET